MNPLLKFTPEQIQSKAEDHVAYGWVRTPGTHDSRYAWSEDDTKYYNECYTKALTKARMTERV